MKSSYKPWLLISAALGLVVPTCWFLAHFFPLGNTFLYPLERAMRVLWPSSIWLMATDGSEQTVSSYVVVAIAVVANVMIYATIGSVLWLLRQRALRGRQ